MKNISLTFLVHQPVRLKRYRFLDIGNDNYYYDDYENERLAIKYAVECYLPNNDTLLEILTKSREQFKVAFSISGTAIDLFTLYAPEVIDSFQQLAATGKVEFLAETYSHSLASLKNKDEFRKQVYTHSNKIGELFGQQPCVFKNTELIYSNEIGEMATEMGFKAVVTDDASNMLQGRNPNHLYCNPINPGLKILFKNSQLSNEIAFRVSNPGWTGSPDKVNNYLPLLNITQEGDEIVNLIIDYEIIGKGKKKVTGINDFIGSFTPAVFQLKEYGFKTPSEIVDDYQSFSAIDIPGPVDSADKVVNPSVLFGNELQQEALEKLYELNDKIDPYTDRDLWKDWQYLQSSDHFYYMSSRFFSQSDVHHNLNPYDNPYEAFMNYMNVLSDFTIRLNNSPVSKNTYNPVFMKSNWKIAAASNYA
jgi:alpha-amylase